MTCWTFWVYHTPAGRDDVKHWRKKDLETKQRSDMDAQLLIWRKQSQWKVPQDFKPLGAGLSELRFKSCGKQLRLIGFHWPAKQANQTTANYTILIGCSHKAQIYDPADALETAMERMKNLTIHGVGSYHEYKG